LQGVELPSSLPLRFKQFSAISLLGEQLINHNTQQHNFASQYTILEESFHTTMKVTFLSLLVATIAVEIIGTQGVFFRQNNGDHVRALFDEETSMFAD
jgi:hypothetical protein